MSELQQLFVVLGFFYLMDCFSVVPVKSILLTSPWRRGWRVCFPVLLLERREKAFFFSNPLPPLGSMFLVQIPDGEAMPSFNVAEAEKRLRAWREESLLPVILCNALFFAMFLVTPFFIWRIGLERTWIPLLVMWCVLVFLIGARFHRAHANFYPEKREERRRLVFRLCFFPPSAIRANDVLNRDLWAAFHPLVAVSLLCPKEEFQRLARILLLDLRHARVEERTESSKEHIKSLERFIESQGTNLEILLKPPSPLDPNSRGFCPRCFTQFTRPPEYCPDCRNIPVSHFP